MYKIWKSSEKFGNYYLHFCKIMVYYKKSKISNTKEGVSCCIMSAAYPAEAARILGRNAPDAIP